MNTLNSTPQIHANGLYRMREVTAAVKISREKLRQLSKVGHFAPPIRISPRCTVYSGAEILRFIADPVNYRVEGRQS